MNVLGNIKLIFFKTSYKYVTYSFNIIKTDETHIIELDNKLDFIKRPLKAASVREFIYKIRNDKSCIALEADQDSLDLLDQIAAIENL